MPSISTDDAEFAFVKETEWGTTPNIDLVGLRATSAGFEQTQDSTQSAEIAAGAQVRDRIRTSVEASGPVGYEFSSFAHDLFWESAFRSTFQLTPEHISNASVTAVLTNAFVVVDESGSGGFSGTDYYPSYLILAEGFGEAANNGLHVVAPGPTATNVPTTSTLVDEPAPPADARIKVVGFKGGLSDIGADADGLTSATINFSNLGLIVGQWIIIGGADIANKFDDVNNNAPCRISSISANALVFDRKPENWGVEAESGTKQIEVWVGDTMRNGAETHSYTLAEKIVDGTVKVFRGARLGSISMTVSPEEILSGSIDFIGQNVLVENTWPGTGIVTPAPAYDVLNAIDNIDNVYVKGTESGLELANLELNIDLSPRGQKAIGALGNVGVVLGKFNTTGTIEAYMDETEGRALYEDYLANVSTSYAFRLKDTENHAYIFDFKAVEFTDGGTPNPGEDQDRLITLDWGAKVDGETQKTAQIDRFYYCVINN